MNSNDASFSNLPGIIELKSCPAFSNSCPFKSANSVEDVSEQLKRIPLGHLNQSGAFFETLKFFHSSESRFSGSCPVKSSVVFPEEWSFHEAMEELSLVGIMARSTLAQEVKESPILSQDSSLKAVSRDLIPGLPTATDGPSLSEALKKGTAAAHEEAESVHFVRNFIRGKIDRGLYAKLVAQLFHLYAKLEGALDEHAPRHFDSCHFPDELQRSVALQEDMEFWYTGTPEISPATKDYIERIEYLCKSDPLLLIAHAYTRYLGDLSGGKILARVAKRALKLTTDDDGLAFYEFKNVASYKLFKDEYRDALNNLNLNKRQIQAVVREANVAFLLNMRLFEELDVLGGCEGATVRPLDQVYKFESFYPQQNTENKNSSTYPSAACPFISNKKIKKASCPWPFVLFHDPAKFFQAWQTWLLLGLLLTLIYHSTMPASPFPIKSFEDIVDGKPFMISGFDKTQPLFFFGQHYHH
jgi:heme oxygenase